ncbi:MAG: efflux RND transporter periplasmic adaptor subunit [Rhizomicrobium sp.]
MSTRRAAFATVLAAAALAGSLSGCGPTRRSATFPPPVVGVVTVRPQAVTLTAELPGRTSPYAVAQVVPQVSGIIQKLLFVQGSHVKAGQPLYQIDPAPYQANYDNAAAALVAAKTLAMRYAALMKENAIAAQLYDNAIASYKEAEATAETARINLNYTLVKSPIAGVAGISNVTVGALVTANQSAALTTVQTLDPIYVDIVQSSTQVLELKQAIAGGQLSRGNTPAEAKVSLKLGDKSTYPVQGTLQFTDVTVDQSTGAVTLRALFPNPHGLLLPGMYVTAVVAEAVASRALLVPQQGVFRDPRGQPIAWVVGKDDKAELRNLTIPRAVGNDWLVTSGLKPGDRLIVEGTLNVRPGLAVKPVPAQLGSAKAKTAADPGAEN